VSSRTIPILLIGLDNSGKTKIGTILTKEHSKYEEYEPTQGSRYFELANYKQHCIKITELGGTEDLRKIWKYYYLETYGVIFVIDSSDAGKLEESRIVFSQVISNEYIVGKPMLILANKQDIFGAIDSIGERRNMLWLITKIYFLPFVFTDICEYFAIEKYANFYRTPCLLQETGSFVSPEDDGLDTGFTWLIQTIEQNLKSLKNRTAFHRKFSEETIPKRVTSSKKRKKVIVKFLSIYKGP
jgi:ADP-ribosylation factor-like protein 13B